MSRASLGPRLWFDEGRQEWVIRDGPKFIRTGAGGWRKAQDMLNDHMDSRTAPAVEAPIRFQTDGFVYFITADFPDFPVKIGFTRKENGRRQRYLQISCPYRLVVLGTFPGRHKDEFELHRRFAAQQLEGEWFSRSPELMEVIKERTSS
jgi:hypothetical protein